MSCRPSCWPLLLWVFALMMIAGAPARAGLTGEVIAPVAQGRPGQIAGASGAAVIVAGGVGTDGRPVSTGAVMVGSGRWEAVELETPVAWSTTAATADDGVICVGGIDSDGCSAGVVMLRWRGGKLEQSRLPDMPAPRALAGAAVVNRILYVTGGVRGVDATEAERDLIALDLGKPEQGWRTLEEFPGPGRVRPTVVAQYDVVHVIGGRAVERPGRYVALRDTWLYRPKAVEGTTSRGWIRGVDMPRAMAGAAGFASGQAHVIVLGGDERPVVESIFDVRGDEGRQTDVLAYHSVTDSWANLGPPPLDATAAVAVRSQGRNLLISPAAVSRVEMKPVVKGLRVFDYAIIVLYFCGMAWIGVHFSKKQTSSTEFALGGRRTKWWVVALSLFATGSSAISFMAIPAQSFATSLVFFATAVAHGLMIIPQAYLVVPMIRRLDLTSTYEYLERRFNPSLRLLASLQCILFQTIGRMSVVLLLPAMAISAVTGLNVLYCVLIMGLLTTFYTAIGGIDAVMWTDVIQAVLMFIGPVLVICVALFTIDGGPAQLFATNWEYGKFRMVMWEWDWTMPVIWIFLIDGLVRFAGFAGDQTMVQRVLCTPSARDARRATLGSWGVAIVSAAIFQFMGIVLFGYFHAMPERLDPTMRNDQVLPLFVVQSLPVGLAGLIIAAVFAASMSTLSSTMNSVATLVVEDFYRKARPNAPDQTRLRLMKLMSYVVGIIGTGIALYMATFQVRSMMATWNTLSALLGGGFLGIYTLGMFSTRANSAGAITGALASIAITAYIQVFTPLHWTLYIPVAILSCITVGYFASLVLPGSGRDLTGLTVFTLRPGGSHANVEHEPQPVST